MFIKSFSDFLYEKVKIKDKTPDHIENYEPKEKKDKDLEDEVEEYMGDVEDLCPRCGEPEDECRCEEADPYSTNVAHRAPRGEVKKSKPKKNFKTD